ncbi:hypothetical protein L6452_37012 [Arctium lappa]|uniref:Uncharacterized protein n=1 Tax=Arctium lappa TaxID=4217 RepID=A0ACB8Y606_ARCLA|nr:hypothetical protein L6452_37012 [Arctium lappa]
MASHGSSTPVGFSGVTTGDVPISTSTNTAVGATSFGISGTSASFSSEFGILPLIIATLSGVPSVQLSASYTVEPPIISQVLPYPPLSHTSTGVSSMTILSMSVITWNATPQSAASRRLFPPPPPVIQVDRPTLVLIHNDIMVALIIVGVVVHGETITNVSPSSISPPMTTSTPDPSLVVDSPSHPTHTSFAPSISSPLSSMVVGLTSPTVVSTRSPVSKIFDYVDGPPSHSTTSTSISTSPI